MLAGSLLAIAQSDVKRMLAYSSIAHAGFILVGVSSGTTAGTQGAMFYLASYAAMILGAFGVVMLVSVRGERNLSLGAYRGLARRSPFLAVLLSVFLLSLAGIPPTAGFMAKVGVFSAAIRAGHWSLALIGLLSSVVAAFFYLRVLVLMYMQEPVGELDEDRAILPRAAIAIPAALTLALGIFPGIALGVLDKASVLRW
jgi:NADH-quinone oxidoreductase subunit N